MKNKFILFTILSLCTFTAQSSEEQLPENDEFDYQFLLGNVDDDGNVIDDYDWGTAETEEEQIEKLLTTLRKVKSNSTVTIVKKVTTSTQTAPAATRTIKVTQKTTHKKQLQQQKRKKVALPQQQVQKKRKNNKCSKLLRIGSLQFNLVT